MTKPQEMSLVLKQLSIDDDLRTFVHNVHVIKMYTETYLSSKVITGIASVTPLH